MLVEKMTSAERSSVGALALIMSLRIIGLFMILPVFALYAYDLTGATALSIGVAMGIYGLTQGLLQIPFGMLSDHIGRKPIIIGGLILFAIGSMLAACAHTIEMMIVGRAMQGAGAIGSTIIASIADLTRESQRTKAMAINGMSIGVAFSLAIIIGPLLATWINVSGLFWLASVFSFIGIIILFFLVPPLPKTIRDREQSNLSQFVNLLKDPQLTRLYSSIFLLHAIFTASFIVIPMSLAMLAKVPSHKQWLVYFPTLIIGFGLSIAVIIFSEKNRTLKKNLLNAIMLLGVAELTFIAGSSHIVLLILSLLLFFSSFSTLEAFLPSWASRVAPQERKGSALGIYSCSQFLGIFVGGSMGGWILGTFGLQYVYLFCALLALGWLMLALGLKNLQRASSPSSMH